MKIPGVNSDWRNALVPDPVQQLGLEYSPTSLMEKIIPRDSELHPRQGILMKEIERKAREEDEIWQKMLAEDNGLSGGGLTSRSNFTPFPRGFDNGGPVVIQEEYFEGMVDGAGGGMDDFVPATIEGIEPILLSRDEYVIPADVVSHIGDGSSERGGELLDEMVANVRMMKTNNDQQPSEINVDPMSLIPALDNINGI